MGREIRRVTPDWQHPKDERGNWIPLLDQSFGEAARRWMSEYAEWLSRYPNGFNEDGETFWTWDGDPPDQETYRPEWTGDPSAYQVYENVSEGTPVSPVFPTVADLKAWLMSDWKLSEPAADYFIKLGFSFSAIWTPERGLSNPGPDTIEAMARLHKE